MIKRFRTKALKEAFAGRYSKVNPALSKRIVLILDVLDAAQSLQDVEGLPGFHPLVGNRQGEYSVTVTGNWRITFTVVWESEVDPNTGQKEDILHVTSVGLEDYH